MKKNKKKLKKILPNVKKKIQNPNRYFIFKYTINYKIKVVLENEA